MRHEGHAEPVPRIEVLGEHEEEQSANGVDVFVSIEGSSFFTGSAALSKAKEVAALVEALAQLGIAQEAIDLVSVRASVHSGVFSKSSSATYELRIKLTQLDSLAQVLGAVSSVKQASLDKLEWQYPSDAASDARLLSQATQRGVIKARAIAEALDAPLGALLSAVEHVQRADRTMVQAFGAPGAMQRARESAPIGMAVQHRRTVRAEVSLTFRLQPSG